MEIWQASDLNVGLACALLSTVPIAR